MINWTLCHIPQPEGGVQTLGQRVRLLSFCDSALRRGEGQPLATPSLYPRKTVALLFSRGKRWRSWLKHCATSRKVAGSICDDIIGIFHWHPSGRDSAFNRNEYQKYFLGVKGSRSLGLTIFFTFLCRLSLNMEPQPPGTLRACPGLYRDCFTSLFFSWRTA